FIMSKRKKRRLDESEANSRVHIVVPPNVITDMHLPEVGRPKRCLEVTFQADQIRNSETTNQIEKGLLKLLDHICSIYNGRYKVYSQSLVNHHLTIFSILGMPVGLSSKSFLYQYTYAIGAHSACTRFMRANQKREGDNYHFTEILRLFACAQRATNNFLYLQSGLAVDSFCVR
ncbi:hypothetical protein PENTCL1PPCAC_30625, partial [Pristionchus entomophagus]